MGAYSKDVLNVMNEKVLLQEMKQEEYQDFMSRIVVDYANEKVAAGTWKEEEALELSKQSMTNLLPEGLNTKDHSLFSIYGDQTGAQLGELWVHYRMGSGGLEAFIYEIIIFEQYQGKGYGKRAMQALDEEVRKQGAVSIGLHVFAHNERAYQLYLKSGYVATDITMKKKLS